MTFTPFLLLATLAFVQALFFALALYSRTSRLGGEKWLGHVMLVMAIEMATLVYQESGAYRLYPDLLWVDAGTEFLFGPLIWCFFLAATQQRLPGGFRLWRHFLPALVMEIVGIYAWQVLPPELRFRFLEEGAQRASEAATGWQPDFSALVLLLLGGAYIWKSWRLIRRYRERWLNEHTHLGHSHLGLFKSVLWIFAGLWLEVLLLSQFSGFWGWAYQAAYVSSALLALSVFALGFAVLRYPAVVLILPPDDNHDAHAITETSPEPEAATTTPAPHIEISDEPARKYARSALDEQAARLLFSELDARMQAEAFWKDPDLDLSTLAERSGWSPHYLSQAINCGAQCNFNDYINRYRIQAVQLRLGHLTANETVLGIALEVGFNSKSAFYSAFKRHTGLSPKAFQAQQHRAA